MPEGTSMRWLGRGLLAPVVLLIMACTPAPLAAPTSGSPPTPAPAPTDQLAVALNVAPASLEPTTGVVGWNLVQLGLGEALGVLTREGTVQPWLAKSWRKVGELEWEIVV